MNLLKYRTAKAEGNCKFVKVEGINAFVQKTYDPSNGSLLGSNIHPIQNETLKSLKDAKKALEEQLADFDEAIKDLEELLKGDKK